MGTSSSLAAVHQSLCELPLRQVTTSRQVGVVIEPERHKVPFAVAVDLQYDTDGRESGQSRLAAGTQPPSPRAYRAPGLFCLQYVLEGAVQVIYGSVGVGVHPVMQTKL